MGLKEGDVYYQIYPISFADGNGDGIGDFSGIEQRTPYLDEELGVDGAWISPFYDSPLKDGGYDISNPFAVNPIHGTFAEAKRMIDTMRRRNMEVIVDFVPSHASTEHQFFQRALQDPHDTRFVFRSGSPNNWRSVFNRVELNGIGEKPKLLPESAWRHVGSHWPYAHPSRLDQYYLTSFSEHQPNWNHDNDEVRSYLRGALKYWLRQGVTGFRMDAIDYMDHDRTYPDEPRNPRYQPHDTPYDELQRRFSMRGPNALPALKELATALSNYPGSFMMLESYPDRGKGADPISHYMKYYDAFRDLGGKVAPFCFELTDLEWKASDFKQAIDSFQARLEPGDVPIYPGGNHDKSRLASRYGEREARAMAVLQLALPGIGIIYQGDELGMTDHHGIPREQLTDPWLGRDVARTPLPMHADDERAGYSDAELSTFRLPIHPEYTRFNVRSQQEDPHSTWNLYQAALKLRKNSQALKHGAYQPMDTPAGIFGFSRVDTRSGEVNISLTNFLPEPTVVPLEKFAQNFRRLVSSSPNSQRLSLSRGTIELGPHESAVFRPLA